MRSARVLTFAALDWGEKRGLTTAIPPSLLRDAAREPILPTPVDYGPNALLRARVLDDFGKAREARQLYGVALRRGPKRRRAAKALYTSGLIHGAPWRAATVGALSFACRLPIAWGWPHRQRLPYLTWNLPPNERLPLLIRPLDRLDEDPKVLLAAANAAKEVEPIFAAELAARAQQNAIEASEPGNMAWATFVLAFARRWHGDLQAASAAARELADGYDALAGPVWIGWGHFELAAIASFSAELEAARTEVELAVEVFATAGSIFEFDAWCAALAIARAAGDIDRQRRALQRARELLEVGPLRQHSSAKSSSPRRASSPAARESSIRRKPPMPSRPKPDRRTRAPWLARSRRDPAPPQPKAGGSHPCPSAKP